MRKILVGGLFLLLLFGNGAIRAGSDQYTSQIMREINVKAGQTIQQTSQIMREVSLKAGQEMQQTSILVPEDILEYDVKLDWALELDKKTLATEKSPAYLAIESVASQNGKKELYYNTTTGSLTIPKGSQYRLTICAGEYMRFYIGTGANVKLRATYPEALVKYSQTQQPYAFNFEALGPDRYTAWKWVWDNRNHSTGKNVTHSFTGSGVKTVVLEAGGNGGKQRRLVFEMIVPPVIKINPGVTPLEGPCNLTVKAAIGTAVRNYGQTPFYSWDFGDGGKANGPLVEHTYVKPGKYNLILTTMTADHNYIRNWLINVGRLTINANGLVTPLSGPVPLEVTATANPHVQGGPADLKYEWEVAGEKYPAKNIKRTFSEPGEYQLILKTTDRLHPDVKIPYEFFTIKAEPPQISSRLEVATTRGTIPLTVNFSPNCQVQGSPVDLKYRWDFGDGSFSVLERPSHLYSEPGEYLVQLIVYDALHPGNLITTDLKITVLPPKMSVEAAANVTKGIVPLNVNFSSRITIQGEPCEPVYIWNFGDGAVTVTQNPVHNYTNEGIYPVTLEVKDRLHPGNSVKTTLQIETRLPKLRLTAQVTPVNGTAPLQIKCQAHGVRQGRANPKFKYTWDFGDGHTAAGPQTKHAYSAPGEYEISVMLWDEELHICERKKVKVTVK